MATEPTIHIDLPVIEGKLGLGIRRVAAFMAIGINAAKSVTRESLELDNADTSYRFFPAEVKQGAVDEAAHEFRAWILTNGLRELCAFIEHYLADLYIAAAWLKMTEGGRISSSSMEPSLPKEFIHKGVSKKLEILTEEFGLSTPNAHLLSTFWDARNCLTHRLGFVGFADLTGGRSALTVRWMGIETWLHRVGEEPELLPIHITEGVETRGGGELVVQTVERAKEFPLGERIDFTAHELSEILLTTHGQCAALMQGVIALAHERGAAPPDAPMGPMGAKEPSAGSP